jgi:signal transduction histidine kinase/ligand-binding sensor domain-containing protein
MGNLIVAALLLTVISSALGQQSGIPGISLNELGYVMRRWSVDDGLPLDTAECVTQTSDGHIWVGTRKGLARFNGTRFHAYRFLDVPGVTGKNREDYDWFFRLHGDLAGRLWMAILPKYLAVYERGRFKLFGPEDGFSGGSVDSFADGSDGEIWISVKTDPGAASADQCLRYRQGRFEKVETIGTSLASGPNEGVWTLQQGVLKRIDSPNAMPEILEGLGQLMKGAQRSLFRDRNGKPAIFTEAGIFTKLAEGWRKTRTFQKALPAARFYCTSESPDGLVWITSGSGLLVCLKDGRVRQVIQAESDTSVILSVGSNSLCDREGNVWICRPDGLYQLIPSPFVTWQMDLTSSGRPVYSVAEDRTGRTWFAASRGIFQWAPGETRVHEVKARLNTDDWFLVGTPFEAAILINRRGGARLLQTDSITPLDQLNLGAGLKISGSKSRNHIWASSSNGLFRITGSNPRELSAEHVITTSDNGFPRQEGVAEDSQGRIYLSMEGLGLTLFEPGQPLRPLSDPNDPAGKTVLSPQADSEDRIWVICHNPAGLGCWDGAKWSFAPWAELGLPMDDSLVTGIMPDDDSGLWVVTQADGVFRLERTSLLSRMRNGGGALAWEQFGVEDGLASNSASFHWLGIHKARDGRIWVATNRGASVIDPSTWKTVSARLPAPPVVIESFVVDGAPVSLAEHDPGASEGAVQPLVIGPGGSRLEVHFNALHFSRPAKVRYRYQLEGYDTDWVECGNRREAYYQKIPPGKYTFRATASNGYGKWNQEGVSAAIIVQPSWWQSVWFRVAAGTVMAGLLVAARSLKLRQTRREQARREEFSRRLIGSQEAERKRIAGELHDSLGQNLLIAKNQLFLVGEMAADSRIQAKLKQITGSVDAALEEARTISYQLRPFQLERLGLSKAIGSMIKQTSDSTKIPIQTKIDSIDALLPDESEVMVYRILQEALSNIVKHADASEVQISIERQAGRIRMVVQDDGRGFEADKFFSGTNSAGGLGLTGIEERSRLLGGNFHCRSAPGEGTTLTFEIPILEQHRDGRIAE